MSKNRFDVDEVLEKPFDKTQFIRLLSFLKPYKKQVALSIMLMIIASVANLAGPYLFKIAIDEHIANSNLSGLTTIAIVFTFITLVTFVCTRFRIQIMSKTGQKILYDIRQQLFTHIQKLSFTFYDSRPVGKIMARLVGDVNSLNDLLTHGVVNVLSDSFILVGIVAIIMKIHFALAMVSLIVLPLLVIVVMGLKMLIRKRWQVVSIKYSNMNAYLQESISGIRVTQAFTREKENTKSFLTLNSDIQKSWLHAVRINNAFGPLLEVVASIGTVLVFWYGARLIIQGEVTVGILVAFIGYLGRFWQPLNNLSNFYNSLLVAMASAERIFDFLDSKPDILDVNIAVSIPPIKGCVEFQNVSFAYEKEVVLKDISFTVDSGQSIALVGPTGAGKSSIINLICRFYDPIEGRVMIDGYDIKDVVLESLRSQLGIVLQETFIFSGSIKDNIRYGRLDATDEEVINAAKAVFAHDFIEEYEKGYDTEVNERGSKLSVGQRQLISFARTILANPAILILDEATSSIDTQTEVKIQKALRNLLKGRTAFIIAHRLSTIRNADRIMVIKDGRIAECGNHMELLNLKGEYHELYKAQYRFIKAV